MMEIMAMTRETSRRKSARGRRGASRWRGPAAMLALMLAWALAIGAGACGGPERAPRQPITGVDRPPEERAKNPHDLPPEREDRESRAQD